MKPNLLTLIQRLEKCNGKLGFLFLFLSLPIVINAYDVKVDGIYYNLCYEKNEAEVTYGDDKYVGIISIPTAFTNNGNLYVVTGIGERAFYDCNTLTEISIPESVTKIDGLAFAYCTGLTSVLLPISLKVIEWYCFAFCSNITTIELPEEMTTIGYGAFSHCIGLKSINIPRDLEMIDRFVFEYCLALNEIIVPEGVSEIGPWAFYGCSELYTVSLPSSLLFIGDEAFVRCNRLHDVYCHAEYPPLAYMTAFDMSIKNTTLHVPLNSIESYCDQEPWSLFENVVAFDDTSISSLSMRKQVDAFYSLGGQRMNLPRKGLNIINKKKVLVFN